MREAKGKLSNPPNDKIECSFDISKEDQVFDYLLKYQQLCLMKGHKIPLTDVLKKLLIFPISSDYIYIYKSFFKAGSKNLRDCFSSRSSVWIIFP